MGWDERWYQRPDGLPLRISAGGVVARVESRDVVVALTREITRGQELPGYVLPKGGVGGDETLLEAARREVMEEAGLGDLTLLSHLGTGNHRNIDWTRWIHAHYFLFTTDQVEGHPTDTEHHYDMGWFPIDALPTLAWRDQHDLLARQRDRILALIHRSPDAGRRL